MIETGWYGIPGSSHCGTKVHITQDRRPLCHAAIRRNAEFQMCSNGVYIGVVECAWCKSAWLRRAASRTFSP